ncbi:MAG: aspartate carbamoyltransferase, partial [Deltaproteobacteria bacterium]|nr:aspartate carbamoyltransferase [Deltaproteobacteria bacterium]
VYYEQSKALHGADVVMSLRMKEEYLHEAFIPTKEEYARRYSVKTELLDKYAPNAIVLAPGPFIRGVEIESKVLDSTRSRVNQQVANGVAVRMAVLFLLCQRQKTAEVSRGEEEFRYNA